MMTFTVLGMTCGGCATRVKHALLAVDPAAAIEIDVPNKCVRIDSSAEAERLAAAIAEAGYAAQGSDA